MPATFAKYLFLPAYILMSLGNAIIPSSPELGGAIFNMGFLYFVVASVGIIALDRTIDKTKRKITAEDGTTTKHVIANNGYYYGVSV